MALPYENEIGLTDQCYQMMTARNLEEMKKALSQLQLMAQNIMVATVQGDIYYLRNGRVPIRPDGVNPGMPIPGNTSANEWKGIHPMSDLVQIENPPCGWMQNCNCSPAAMMNQDQPPADRYSEHRYLYNERPSADSHQRAEMVTDLLESAEKVTAEQAIDIAFSTQVWHAERWQDRLEQAWKHGKEADKGADLAQYHDLIRNGIDVADPDSTGALAYYAFKKALGRDLGKQTEPPASLTDEQVLAALAQGRRGAEGQVRRGRGSVWPLLSRRPPGRRPHLAGWRRQSSRGRHGHPRAISFAPTRDGKQQVGHSGQSSTQIVIMTDPPESYAVIPLGESDHKESGHWDDQAEKLFSQGKAVRTYFLRPDELMKHVTSRKILNPKPV